jgi:hypothetical protein
MLVANGAQALGFLALRISVDIVIADPDARMTPDVVIDPGHRDAALLMHDYFGRGLNDLRIDIGPHTIVCVEVEHHHPQGNADVRRGDSDPRRGVMVSGRSLARSRSASSNTVTGCAGSASRGSGYRTIGRMGMISRMSVNGSGPLPAVAHGQMVLCTEPAG